MRAKVYCKQVTKHMHGEEVTFVPVCGKQGTDNVDEDNTYSKYTPSGEIKLMITNPELLGKFIPDHKSCYYVDFTPVPAKAE